MKATLSLVVILSSITATSAMAHELICISEKTQKEFEITFNESLTKVMALESVGQSFTPGTVKKLQTPQYRIVLKLNRGRNGAAEINVKWSGDSIQGIPVYAGTANIKGLDTHEINTDGTEKVSCYLY